MEWGFLGIGSNLDLPMILDKLKVAEQESLRPTTKQKKGLETKISAFGQLKSDLAKLLSATQKLSKDGLFTRRIVESNDESYTATASSKAELGNYTITIEAVAKAHSVISTSIKASHTKLGNADDNRILTITQANGKTLKVDLSREDTSLEAIANAINNGETCDENGKTNPSGLVASVVRSGDNAYQLVIMAKATGPENQITEIASTDPTLNHQLSGKKTEDNTIHLKTSIHPENAQLTFNGIKIESASNTIKDIVPGLHITLRSKTTAEKTLTINTDPQKDKKVIKEWIDSFNALQASIATLTKFNPIDRPIDKNQSKEDTSNGPLIGDTTLRDLDKSIRFVLATSQQGDIKILSQMGINRDETGKLAINEEEFEKAFKSKPEAVAEFFNGNGENTGLVNQLEKLAEDYLKRNGKLETVTEGLKSKVTDLQKAYDKRSESIEKKMQGYQKQFMHLDKLVSKLKGVSNFLENHFIKTKK